MLSWQIAGFLIQLSCGIRCKGTDDKQGVLQVTPFVDFGNVWNPRESAVLEANLCCQRDCGCGDCTAKGGMLAEAGEFL
ncbi:hypothetical protein [Microcoleus vaginatus]|uniref:hypothetical protein n=1 Tax=Microcoleus vaginatus TaxID=119532 RepID=UPI0016884ACD|nr:hypothetical protein [Microcoleus sp. FACHB-84]MBD2007758.1 hypothetical protein [Microcoleus sp. FACHB-45]